jgi:biopolymer transport protein ExbD
MNPMRHVYLGGALFLRAVLAAQEPAPKTDAKPSTPPATAPSLPKSTHGEAPGRIDAEIEIQHTAPCARECKAIGTPQGCTDAEHWAVELRWPERKIVVATDGKMLDKLDAPLVQMAKATAAKPKPGSNDPEVDAVVSIHAAPDAPFAQVQRVIGHASSAGVRWIAIAVASGDTKAAERSLTVLLPPAELLPPAKGDGNERRVPAEIRFELFRDLQSGACRRRFVTRLVSNDDEMQRIVQECHADFERANRPDIPGIVEAEPGVPWQQVVDVVGAFHVAKLWYVQFLLRSRAQEPPLGATPGPAAPLLVIDPAKAQYEGSAPEHREWIAAHSKALGWLVASFAEDGHVPAVDARTREPAADVAATAVTLLAFCSGGSTLRVGMHRMQVRKATKWLVDQQREDGFFCDPTLDGAGVANALAAAALVQTYVDSSFRPYEAYAARALPPFASATAHQPHGELLAAAIAVLAARHFAHEDPRALERLSTSLAANGSCREQAGSFALVGGLPGTQDLGVLVIAMACRGTAAMPDADTRWTALAARVREMPTRFGKNGELLDAATLWCASDVAFQLGGEVRAAVEHAVL